MKIILHSAAMGKKSEKLKKLIHDQMPEIEIKLSTGIETLKQTLCRPLNGISVAVLMVSSVKDLEQLLRLQSFFDNMKLILIMSGKMTLSQTKEFELQPCYISYPGSDLNHTLLVLKKIKEKLDNSETKHT